MLITRKKNPPLIWAFFSQLTLILSIYGAIAVNTPFLFLIKRFIDNPAAIMGLISIEVYVTLLGAPFVAWLSDRIWTRYGRRKMFVASADFIKGLCLILMPWAPNLWVLIALRWAFGIFGDLGSPGQSLIWEVVPPKQRGRSAGFLKATMDIGNVVFFAMLLGRIDDTYFMGPFQFVTSVSGGALIFWVGSLVFFGVALFEWFGFKEIYPPGRKRLYEGRHQGENTFIYFLRTVFKDIFAKDFLPLYLLLFANIMFAFSLGVFQPLLFVEQWGYPLQMFGNTIAIGMPLGIALGIIAGWLADKYGKLRMLLIATIGNLCVNIIYTTYVAFLPDHRPFFLEIVFFGNVANIFMSIKAVSAGPLIWEFVARNRMGAATAGVTLFNGFFRNSIALFVGLWLMWWSIWFFPQAGYSVTATLNDSLGKEEIIAQLEAAGLDPEDYVLQPRHQYGVDGKTSERWWIHKEDDKVQELVKELEDINNETSRLESKKESIFTSEEEEVEIQAEIDANKAREEEINAFFEAKTRDLEDLISPSLSDKRFRAGDQVWRAQMEENELVLELQTIEPLDRDPNENANWLRTQIIAFTEAIVGEPKQNKEALRENIRGEEVLLIKEKNEEGKPVMTPAYQVEQITSEDGILNGLRLAARLDPRFMEFFEVIYDAGLHESQAFELSSALSASLESQFGRDPDSFTIADASVVSTLAEDPETEKSVATIQFVIDPNDMTGEDVIADDDIASAINEGDAHFEVEEATLATDHTYHVTLHVEEREIKDVDNAYSEAAPKIAALMEGSDAEKAFALVMVRRLANTLAAQPLNITVPKHEVEADHKKRTYEYYFASQVLQMGTDVFGILIILMIYIMEKRGKLVRHGALEDENR